MTKQKPTSDNSSKRICANTDPKTPDNRFESAHQVNFLQTDTISGISNHSRRSNGAPTLPGESESNQGSSHVDGARGEAGRLTTKDSVAVPTKEKDWYIEDYRAAIQHWNFYTFEDQRLEVIDEAEAALFDTESGPVSHGRRCRTSYVSERVLFGLMKVLREYGYAGFSFGLTGSDLPASQRQPKMKMGRTPDSQELPAWLPFDYLQIESWNPDHPDHPWGCLCPLCFLPE